MAIGYVHPTSVECTQGPGWIGLEKTYDRNWDSYGQQTGIMAGLEVRQ